MLKFCIIFLVLLHQRHYNITVAYDANDCHFAQTYAADALFKSPQLQEEFLLRASWWQGAFGRHGFGRRGPVTLHGTEFTFDSYLPRVPIFNGYTNNRPVETNPYNEAIHLALLAAALHGDAYAMEFFRSSQHTDLESETMTVNDFILNTLSDKMTLYAKFYRTFPGYGGYLPFINYDLKTNSLLPAATKAVVYSTLFGHLAWAMIAVAEVLQEKNHTQLSRAYNSYVQLLAKSSLTMFYQRDPEHGNNQNRMMLMSWVRILNETAGCTQLNYRPPSKCRKNPQSCNVINDVRAELLTVFLLLYANWNEHHGSNKTVKEISSTLRQMTAPAYFYYEKNDNNNKKHAKNKKSSIIVEKRDYFEADELIKFLFLPYLDVPICEQLFLNANRVSTIYSNINNYPGLFAWATKAVTNALDFNFTLVSPGIPEVSYYQPTKNDVVMPFAAFPLFLHPASWRYGVVWYANMLNSTVSQTSLGAMDTIKMTGDFCSLTMFWYTGPLNVLAFGGGLSAMTRRYLKSTGKYDSFYRLFDQQYNSIFQNKMDNNSDDIPFALPSRFMPKVGINRPCDPGVNHFDNPEYICITVNTWKKCYSKANLIRNMLSLIALPFIILVLYVSIVKHRNEAAVHKYFTLHLFIVHLVTALVWPAIVITSAIFPSIENFLILNNDVFIYQTYLDRYYVTHLFTLIMSLTLFTMASSLLLPFFYRRWMASAKKFNCYVAICHVIAMLATYPGGLFDESQDKLILRHQNGSYVLYVTASFYAVLICTALATVYVIFQTKKRAKTDNSNNNNVAAAQGEIIKLISSLLYAIVPTIWCLGSQVSDFLFLMGAYRSLESISSYNFQFHEVEYYFRASYPLAHSIATLVGLGPYRRSLVKMLGDLKKKNIG